MNAEKTPLTRLLDMTAGWAEFVQNEKGQYPDAVSAAELCDLYQQAGALSVQDGLSAEEEARQVRAFVEERLLPLLLRPAHTPSEVPVLATAGN